MEIRNFDRFLSFTGSAGIKTSCRANRLSSREASMIHSFGTTILLQFARVLRAYLRQSQSGRAERSAQIVDADGIAALFEIGC